MRGLLDFVGYRVGAAPAGGISNSFDPRELAFFGGWTRRIVAGGDHRWGSPSLRVQEVAPSAAAGLLLPEPSPWRQRGVPHWVVNTGAANLAVKDPVDHVTIWTVGAGTVSMFILGANEEWLAKPIGFVQFGSVMPALRYTVDITTSTPNVNVLQRVIALGYTGAQPAAVTCRVRSGVAIGTTHQANRSLTTGNTIGGVAWAAGSFVRLVVEPEVYIGGWGGNGGRGGVPGTGAAAGLSGQNGGQAIRAEIPLRIECFGQIFGGGGGGGGGGSSLTVTTIKGGGGGGGRGCRMAPNGALLGSLAGGATAPAGPGSPGGPTSAGGNSLLDPFLPGVSGIGVGGGGNGGSGGGAAGIGVSGGASTTLVAGGLGGQPGAAISYLPAVGAPVVLFGGSNILGAIVSEAV